MMTEEQMEIIAQRAADKAVARFATAMGIQINDPRDMQSDMIFIRRLRSLCESAGSKVVMTVIGLVVMAVAVLVGKSLWPGS